METVNVAIIGCGYIGTRHAENLRRVPGATVATFVDQDIDRAAHLRQTAGTEAATVTADARAVFDDPHVHAVVIATHHDSHVPLAVAAARAGKHLFVEKPLALTNEGCREIEAAVQKTGVHLVMGFQTRHAPLVRRARDWVPNPRVVFGQIVVGRWDDASWAQRPETGGGNVLSQGVHGFDLLAHLAGAPPRVLFAEGGTITHDPATTEVIDTVLATIRFANGVVGSAIIGDFGPSPWTQAGFYGLFDGTGRSATLHHFSEGLSLGTAGSQMIPFEPPREPAQELTLADLSDEDRADPYGYGALIAAFVTCARDNRPPAISGTVRDGAYATAAVLACFESIRTGQPVTLAVEQSRHADEESVIAS
ncbi:MAG TPA: Gfo/Idh/MocA family oxidoreductase [Thermomicrobiales bacterium]|nr:Gfo/Idh/MocA family oxidoreductase [Thermomicrobiales bacterium]